MDDKETIRIAIMAGIKNFYPDKIKQYVDLINAGNEFILDFNLNPVSFNKLIEEIENEVIIQNINQNKIDNSIKKILEMKGYEIK